MAPPGPRRAIFGVSPLQSARNPSEKEKKLNAKFDSNLVCQTFFPVNDSNSF
jgi:hypothetical protein